VVAWQNSSLLDACEDAVCVSVCIYVCVWWQVTGWIIHVCVLQKSCLQLAQLPLHLHYLLIQMLVWSYFYIFVPVCIFVCVSLSLLLQAVLHAAAWLITGVQRNDHIMPTLRDTLHWLPVSQRIKFKIPLMTYDCIHGWSPVYFRDICSPIVSVPFRSLLCSADNDDMIVPHTRTARYGPRSFRVVAPEIWNMLPSHLKNGNVSREQFKSSLKTWLFMQAYS